MHVQRKTSGQGLKTEPRGLYFCSSAYMNHSVNDCLLFVAVKCLNRSFSGGTDLMDELADIIAELNGENRCCTDSFVTSLAGILEGKLSGY